MRVEIIFDGIRDGAVADNIAYEVYKRIGEIVEFVIHDGQAEGFWIRIERDEDESRGNRA